MDTLPLPAQDGNIPLKRCPQCKELLPATLEFFNKRSSRKAGLSSECKKCVRARNKKFYQQNTEREKKRSLDYWREHREERNEYSRRWHREHHEEELVYKREHREESRAYNKWYRQTPQGKANGTIHNHKRRARLMSIPGSFTAQEFAEQVKRQKNKCYWCGKKLTEIHADHIIPITRPGSTNFIHNIVAACSTCNLRKHNKMPHEWPEGGKLL